MSYASSISSDGSDHSSDPEPLPVETYVINLRLENFSPIVWRQLQVSSDITLLDLHNYIQRYMGWKNVHCWTFSLFKGVPSLQAPVNDFFGEFAGRVRSIDDEEQAYNGAAERVLLSQYLRECGEIIKYQYDYGDNWQVEIKLLDHFKEEPAEKVTCIAGARQGPPDDIGDTEGFSEFVEAMRQGSGEAYEQYVANYKISSFDFNWFDREQLTRPRWNLFPISTTGDRSEHDSSVHTDDSSFSKGLFLMQHCSSTLSFLLIIHIQIDEDHLLKGCLLSPVTGLKLCEIVAGLISLFLYLYFYNCTVVH